MVPWQCVLEVPLQLPTYETAAFSFLCTSYGANMLAKKCITDNIASVIFYCVGE